MMKTEHITLNGILTHLTYIAYGSVIYWAWTGVTSFSRQIDFHDVIYHIRHCNVDNRRRNVVFTTTGRSKRTLNTHFSLSKSCRNSYSLIKMADSLLTAKDLRIFLIFLRARIEINSHWQ